MNTLSVMNQKGGVGKTTTTFNFSAALAAKGQSILLIDADPQGHLAACFGEHSQQAGLDDILLSAAPISELATSVRENLDLVVAGARLGELEITQKGGSSRGYRLHDAISLIQSSQKHYDKVIIDCPPASGLLAMNALLASDELLIPVTGDFLALQGLSRLMQVVTHIEQRLEKTTRKRFVLTRFNRRRKLALEIQTKLIEYFPGQVLQTNIRENVALAEAPGFAKTIFEYRRKSNGAIDYAGLAEDYLVDKVLPEKGAE